jgi:hypothetical protein
MIGLLTNEQKKEFETDLKIAQILKKEKSLIKKEPKEEVVKKNKCEVGKYMNSQSLNYIYN